MSLPHPSPLQAGVVEIDITPPVGVGLSGFAAREQPSMGRLDPLSARFLWLAADGRRLLWIHCDVIGYTSEFVAGFRAWAENEFGLDAASVLLTATHTHSGPPTIRLDGAGGCDPDYLASLRQKLQQGSRVAFLRMEPCEIVTAEGAHALAVHRAGPSTRHVDNRVAVVGLRRANGNYLAILANHAIHPVALGHENCSISGDVSGAAARAVARRLKEGPTVFVINGACGNLNPPAVNVPWARVQEWGEDLAGTIESSLYAASRSPEPILAAVRRCVDLPLEVLSPEELAGFVARTRASLPSTAFGEKLGATVLTWQQAQLGAAAVRTRRVELHVVQLGDIVFVGVDAEIFSEFNDRLIRGTGLSRVYAVGYANGDHGYICPRGAYADGGYEVDMAHVFYGGWRFAAGAFEHLADEAVALLRREFAPGLARAGQSAVEAKLTGGAA